MAKGCGCGMGGVRRRKRTVKGRVATTRCTYAVSVDGEGYAGSFSTQKAALKAAHAGAKRIREVGYGATVTYKCAGRPNERAGTCEYDGSKVRCRVGR